MWLAASSAAAGTQTMPSVGLSMRVAAMGTPSRVSSGR